MSDRIPPEIVEFLGAEPTAGQWRAISWPLEPYVLIAGAGSGKTSVMAARVIWLALRAIGATGREGVWPGNVLCLTFTNKATENLVARIRRALTVLELPDGEEPEVTNYHGFAQQILDRYGMLEGIEPDQRVLTPAQRVELCGRVLDLMPFEHVTTQWQPTIVGNILELADQGQNHLVEPDDIVRFNERRLEELAAHRSDRAYRSAQERIELAKAAKLFHRLKRDLGVIDFGDQIGLANRIVQRHPEVGAELRARFAAVLLDEYQDTNVAQARLLEGVFGSGHPVTAVGDPDQNIYAWRGASLFNLFEFPERFRRTDGRPAARLPLYTNFRSGRRILAAADALMASMPPSQRPDPDKRLDPWAPNGEGEVVIERLRDEVVEADAIAERIHRLRGDGHPWRGIAVLCRTSRLFPSLQRAFERRHIPVEIVGLAGLLKVPEVVEVLAYARAVASPSESVALGRILLGPRYRVGFRDLARVAAWAKGKTYALRDEDEDLSEDVPFLVGEALEHLDEVVGLSDEGRERLDGFRDELALLRAEARRPVPEFLAEVIRRIGLLTELDAALDADLARSRRRNLAAFLDEVHAFSPLEGQLTLQRFLDYVDVVERGERDEWSPAQPSEADSVKVMTIHAAKGLEFDTVFVPGLAEHQFPNDRIQHNPAERGRSLDFELRGDAELLPRYRGVLKTFKDELKAQEVIEERRTCYVAMTRARRLVVVSGAHWYGETQRPHGPGAFLQELSTWGLEEALATVTPGPDVDEENPLAGYREELVRDWPGPARPNEADALFTEGWRRVAAEAAELGGVPERLLAALSADERETYGATATARRTLARHLVAEEAMVDPGPAPPSSIGVGRLIDYGRCPKLFFWSSVRPLPRFPGPSARIGSEIHRWIELRSRGQATLLEAEEERPDLTVEELAGAPGKLDDLRRSFLGSRFADMVPLYAERPFLLPLEGVTVTGRIDAIFGAEDGPWEVVDYKTGRRPPPDDPLARAQLDLYGLACVEVWHKPPAELSLTYLYLASGEEVTHALDDVEAVRRGVSDWLRGILAGGYDPTPGPHCHWCDFLPFCDAGTAWVRADRSEGDASRR
ncbi:MAG TPA: ATP-dependent DNA helicase [Actinomycetota bacterium]|nr:ATP-dependent DNA helicase [Actinomycetota bacterium]